jgi:hypothetical protein
MTIGSFRRRIARRPEREAVAEKIHHHVGRDHILHGIGEDGNITVLAVFTSSRQPP